MVTAVGDMTPASLLAARRCDRLVREGSARFHRLDMAGAEPLLREALSEAERSGRAKAIARASQQLYFLLRRQCRNAEAAETLELKVEAHRRLDGVDGRWTDEWRNELIGLYGDLGCRRELEAVCRERLESEIRRHGDRSPEAAWALLTLAWALRAAGRWTESAALCRHALELIEEVFGCDHPRTGWALVGLGLAAGCQGAHADAELALRRARANWARVGHADRVAAVDELLIDLYVAQGRCHEALDLSAEAAGGRPRTSDERRLRGLERRAGILRALGRDGEAATCADDARELARTIDRRRLERDRLDTEAPDTPAANCTCGARLAGPLFPSPLL
jgi:tetratricopeptide (TPR) repeat protein